MGRWTLTSSAMDTAADRDRTEGRSPSDPASMTALASSVFGAMAYAGSGLNQGQGLNTPEDQQLANRLAAIAVQHDDLSGYTEGEIAAMFGL